jgi:hypothetical protein
MQARSKGVSKGVFFWLYCSRSKRKLMSITGKKKRPNNTPSKLLTVMADACGHIVGHLLAKRKLSNQQKKMGCDQLA